MKHRFLHFITRSLPIMALLLAVLLVSSPTDAANSEDGTITPDIPLPVRVDSY